MYTFKSKCLIALGLCISTSPLLAGPLPLSPELHNYEEQIILGEQYFMMMLPSITPAKDTLLKVSVEAYLRLKYRNSPKLLRSERRRFAEMGPHERQMVLNNWVRLPSIYRFIKLAEAKARNHCGGQTSAGPEDAFRHVMWSSLLTYQFGKETAHEITAAHEMRLEKLSKKQVESIGFTDGATLDGQYLEVDGVTYLKNWTTAESHMDIFNNYVGRLLGEEARSYTTHFSEAVSYIERRTYELLDEKIPKVIRNSALPCYSYPYYSKDYQKSRVARSVHFEFGLPAGEPLDTENFEYLLLGANFALGSWHLDDAIGPLKLSSDGHSFVATVDLPETERKLTYRIFKLHKKSRKVQWRSKLITNVLSADGRQEHLFHHWPELIISMR